MTSSKPYISVYYCTAILEYSFIHGSICGIDQNELASQISLNYLAALTYRAAVFRLIQHLLAFAEITIEATISNMAVVFHFL